MISGDLRDSKVVLSAVHFRLAFLLVISVAIKSLPTCWVPATRTIFPVTLSR